MRNLSKKSIGLVLVFTILMAIFMPTIANAASIGRIGSGARVTFNETATDSETVASSTDMEEYINSKKDSFIEALTAQNVSVNLSYSNIDPNTLFSTSEPYKYAAVTNVESGFQMIDATLIQTYTVSYKSYTVTKEADSNIIRKTTTVYHTKVEGTLSITGTSTYTKNYSSGDNYLNGNYSDAEVADIISGYKQDIQSIVESYNAMDTFVISEGVSEYYYEAHDEITQEHNNDSDVIQVGDLNDLNQGQITINTILEKYQIYKINARATSTSATETTIISETAEEIASAYEFIDNTANQTYKANQGGDLTFRINADYSLFENGGAVYVDGTETTEYTSKSGSTIVTLNKDFVNSLSVGEHTLKVAFNNGGEATTKFTIESEESTSNSPKTGDNISVWISLMAISMLGIAVIMRYTKKRK